MMKYPYVYIFLYTLNLNDAVFEHLKIPLVSRQSKLSTANKIFYPIYFLKELVHHNGDESSGDINENILFPKKIFKNVLKFDYVRATISPRSSKRLV